MNTKPLLPEQKLAIEIRQQELNEYRKRLGVSAPGHRLTWFIYDEDIVSAVANGDGSAKLSWYEEVGEDETQVYRVHVFNTEQEAHDAAEWLRIALDDYSISRSEFFDSLTRGERLYRVNRV